MQDHHFATGNLLRRLAKRVDSKIIRLFIVLTVNGLAFLREKICLKSKDWIKAALSEQILHILSLILSISAKYTMIQSLYDNKYLQNKLNNIKLCVFQFGYYFI